MCNMAKNDKGKTKRETISCGALPWRIHEGKRQVLLIKQFTHRDRWGVPKGHLDKGEDLQACAVREVMEETGVRVCLGRELPDVHVTSSDERKTVKTWFATAVGSDVPNINDPDSEVADARWFDIDELPEVVAYQRALLQGAVDVLRSVDDRAIIDLIVGVPIR